MAEMLDVVKYILERCGPMTSMKLQKLMYYSQAWNLVWAEEPLFEEDFQAWANGPVLPRLYAHHRGEFQVSQANFPTGQSNRLSPQNAVNIEKVLSFYGDKTAQWLSNLTHQEPPWLSARAGTPPGDSSEALVSKLAMHEYYSAL